MNVTLQQLDSTFCHQENDGMTKQCLIYGPFSPSSSMAVFEHMGSLSISPSYGAYCSKSSSDQRGLPKGFPLMGNCSTSLDDAQNSDQGGGDCSETSVPFGENTGVAMEVFNRGINLNEEKPREGSGADAGQSKLCARGHWRPAEDSKLRELVSLYGPQNWNLIAEKLEGRSGSFTWSTPQSFLFWQQLTGFAHIYIDVYICL